MPSGIYLIGSRDGAERNLMTANWVTQVASEPKTIGVGIERDAVTHGLIQRSSKFSVCILSRADRALVRSFVKPCEFDPESNSLSGYAVVETEAGLPVLASSLAYFDCEVSGTLEYESHTFFAGEVREVRFLAESEEAEVLRMEDTRMHYGG